MYKQSSILSDINANDFKILHQIKTSDSYQIFAILHRENGKIYSCKIIKAIGNEHKYKQNINQIIKSLLKCQHPTIVHFVGYSLKDFDGQNNVTIFMEHYQNSLSKLIQEGFSFDHTNIQIILIGVARAMMYLSEQNFFDFDLDPENILIDDKLQPHLTNFIPDIQDIKKTASIYTAPEILEGNPTTIKSSIYSFGILMYQLISNTVFYKNEEERSKLIEKVIKEKYCPEINSSIKGSMRALIEKCLSKDPNDRPSFEEIFNKLAYNVEDAFFDIFNNNTNYFNDQNNYYLDDIDVTKVQNYVEFVDSNELNKLKEKLNCFENFNEKLLDSIAELKPENKQLRKENLKLKIENQKMKYKNTNLQDNNEIEQIDISINEFNSLPLQSKQLIISEIIDTLPDFKENQFFINVNNLLLYLLKFDQTKNCKYFKILSDDTSDVLANKDQKFQIQFQHELMKL